MQEKYHWLTIILLYENDVFTFIETPLFLVKMG